MTMISLWDDISSHFDKGLTFEEIFNKVRLRFREAPEKDVSMELENFSSSIAAERPRQFNLIRNALEKSIKYDVDISDILDGPWPPPPKAPLPPLGPDVSDLGLF